MQSQFVFQQSTGPMQLCEACHLEINHGDSFVKESTQLVQNGRPIEVDVRIYHEGCVV